MIVAPPITERVIIFVRLLPGNKKALQMSAFVSAKGLEPLTNGLKGHCSAIELRALSERDFTTPRGCRQQMRASAKKIPSPV